MLPPWRPTRVYPGAQNSCGNCCSTGTHPPASAPASRMQHGESPSLPPSTTPPRSSSSAPHTSVLAVEGAADRFAPSARRTAHGAQHAHAHAHSRLPPESLHSPPSTARRSHDALRKAAARARSRAAQPPGQAGGRPDANSPPPASSTRSRPRQTVARPRPSPMPAAFPTP